MQTIRQLSAIASAFVESDSDVESTDASQRDSSISVAKIQYRFDLTHILRQNPITLSTNFAIGELKGNAALLLQILAVKGIVHIRDGFYEKLWAIQSTLMQCTQYPTSAVMRDYLVEIRQILSEGVCFNSGVDKCNMVLLGGELLSGHPIDLIMFEVFSKLDKGNMPFKILVSESSIRYFKGLETPALPHGESVQNQFCWEDLCYKYREDFFLRVDLTSFYSLYRNHVSILSYEKYNSDPQLLLFHRFFSFRNVQNLVNEIGKRALTSSVKLGQEFRDIAEYLKTVHVTNWMQESKKIIDQINDLFSVFLKMEKCSVFFEQIWPLDILTQINEPDEEKINSPSVVCSCVYKNKSSKGVINLEGQIFEGNMTSIEVLDISQTCIEKNCSDSIDISQRVCSIPVCLKAYPIHIQPRPHAFVLGDLHGNPLVLITSLIVKGLISMPPDKFTSLVSCIEKFAQPCQSQADFKLLKANLLELLGTIKLEPDYEKTRIILVGDELADRGPNDIVMLYLLQWLDLHHFSYEITFSNHSFEHMRQANGDYDVSYLTDQETTRHCLLLDDSKAPSDIISLTHLLQWIDVCGKEVCDEIRTIYRTIYLKHVKLLSYYFSDDELTLIFHACIGLKTIEEIAGYFNLLQPKYPPIQFRKDTAQELMKSIDDLNERFLLIFDDVIEDIVCRRDLTHPIVRILWERNESQILRKQDFIAYDGMFKELIHQRKPPCNFKISIIHGHSGEGFVYPNLMKYVVNLDDLLGKNVGFSKGILKTVDW